jgi:hypothetical protein
MRYWLLALAACNPNESESCTEHFRSQVTHVPKTVASGRDLIGISWAEQLGESAPIFHAAIVGADGSIGPEIRIGEQRLGGKTGSTTVLWYSPFARDDCERKDAFEPTLQRGGEAIHLSVAATTWARTAAFDGVRYQLFWISEARTLQHQSLDEDGTLGPVHDLGGVANTDRPCVSAASDGAGTTFVRFDGAGFFVDTATGAAQRVWTAPQFSEWFAPVFYFAGQFHVVDYRWFSIDPASRTSTQRTYPPKISGANNFFAGTTRVYGALIDSVQALDTQLEPVDVLPLANPGFGNWGDDAVLFEAVELDEATLTPGRLVLTRTGVWSQDVTVDSPLETEDNCNNGF